MLVVFGIQDSLMTTMKENLIEMDKKQKQPLTFMLRSAGKLEHELFPLNFSYDL